MTGQNLKNWDKSEELAFGKCLVSVRVAFVKLPGAEGWIGSWEIYLLPWYDKKLPVRIGETDVQSSKGLALGMARAIAIAVAGTY